MPSKLMRWAHRAVALAAAGAVGSAPASVNLSGDTTPWVGSPPPDVAEMPGTIFEIGKSNAGAYGWLSVGDGARLTAGGVRVYGGEFNVIGDGSFVQLAGADRALWIGYGRTSISRLRDGRVQATGACEAGTCDMMVGGTTGLRYTGDVSNGYPFRPGDNRATGYVTIENSGSSLDMDGVLRVGRAWVDAAGVVAIPRGVAGGTAAGVVNVWNGAALRTGAAQLAIGPSGPGRNGTEQAFAAVNLSGGARWDIVRNAASGTQALLTLGVRGEGGAAGDRLQADVNVWDGSTLFVDGRSGGTNPGIVLADGGLVSHGLLQVGGTGSQLVIAGNTGFINLGGSGGSAGGWGGLFVSNGAQVRGEGDSGLAFVSVGRNGSEVEGDQRAFGELRVDGAGSLLTLSGRDQTMGPGRGQSAFLSIGRGGAGGSVGVTNGAHIVVDAPAYADGVTTTGAGFAIARDAGSFGDLWIEGPGSALTVRSSDRRPFAAVGQAGIGQIWLSSGAQLQLLATNATAPGNSLLYVGGGGTGAAIGQGLLDMIGQGTGLLQGGDIDNHLLLVGSGTAGTTGRVLMRDSASLTTTRIVLGQGANTAGTLDLAGGAVTELRGRMRESMATGANVVVGHGGGAGTLNVNGAGSRLFVDSDGSFAGLLAGGSGVLPGGSGQIFVGNGGTVNVLDRGRFDHGIVLGRGGTARVDLYDSSLAVFGAGRLIVGAGPGSDALVVTGNSQLEAGRVLIVGGDEAPTDASQQVHYNGWTPLALNQSPGEGQGARGYLHLDRGTVLRTQHAGFALQPQASGGVGLFGGAKLQVDESMMIGALGYGFANVESGGLSLDSDSARLTLGGFAGGRGDMAVRAAGQVELPGTQSLAVVGSGGHGTLFIENGGRFGVAAIEIGAASSGVGSVTMRAGAQLYAGSLVMGNDVNSSISILEADGPGARLDITKQLEARGQSQINVSNGAWLGVGAEKSAIARASVDVGKAGALVLSGASLAQLVETNPDLLQSPRLSIQSGGTAIISERGTLVLDSTFRAQSAPSSTALEVVHGRVSVAGNLEVTRVEPTSRSGVPVFNSTISLGRRGNSLDPFGIGSLEVSLGGTLSVTGREAPLVSVFDGVFDAGQAMRLNLTVHGQPSAIGPLLMAGASTRSGSSARISNIGTVNVSFPDWTPAKAGETAALVVAGRINGEGTLLPRLGDRFVAPTPASGLRLMAETLRTGCNVFADLVNECGTDVFGVRSVKSVSSGLMPAPAPIPTMTTLSEAKDFALSPRSIVGARLARDVYDLGPTPVPREVSRIELDGLRAFAYDGTYLGKDGAAGREISIVIRGTLNDDAFQANWAANLGFRGGSTTNVQRQYLQNLSEFTASVLDANPGANIRFLGHSLGGGLAMILGAATGFEALGFNAPPIGNVVPLLENGEFQRELTALQGRGIVRQSYHHLVNTRISLDGVSGLPLPEIGQWISIAPDALDYLRQHPEECISSPACAAISQIRAFFPAAVPVVDVVESLTTYHSMATFLAQLVSPQNRVLDLSYNGELVSGTPLEIDPTEAMKRIFLAPEDSGTTKSASWQRDVVPFLEHFLDPEPSQGWLFTSNPGSPMFKSIRPPELGLPDEEFRLQILEDGLWTSIADLDSLEQFVFADDGVSKFRLMLDQELPADVQPKNIFFSVTFASEGVFDGSIAAVPEPKTYAMIFVGLLLIGLRYRYIRRSPAFAREC